ncbi:MAG: hypothetical protein U0790_08310 [Isosphaeraceae bacterium]
MFKEYYRRRFREILGDPPGTEEGLGDQVVRDDLDRTGLVIPTALADYYVVAGRHWINEHHNRLRPITALEWLDDRLVFMEENQAVVFWGIPNSDLDQADPIVWQGVNGERVEWYPEDYRLSRFLMAMWKWTMTGEQEPPETT